MARKVKIFACASRAQDNNNFPPLDKFQFYALANQAKLNWHVTSLARFIVWVTHFKTTFVGKMFEHKTKYPDDTYLTDIKLLCCFREWRMSGEYLGEIRYSDTGFCVMYTILQCGQAI